MVGGSVASSVYGIPRATQDVDLVADIKLPNVEPITNALAGEFYIDADMIREAIQRRASFNAVHFAMTFKADGFILQGDSSSHEEMARGREEQLKVQVAWLLVRRWHEGTPDAALASVGALQQRWSMDFAALKNGLISCRIFAARSSNILRRQHRTKARGGGHGQERRSRTA